MEKSFYYNNQGIMYLVFRKITVQNYHHGYSFKYQSDQ